MIAKLPPIVRIVFFERFEDDLHATETLLGRVVCSVDTDTVVSLMLYRAPDRHLIVGADVHRDLDHDARHLIDAKVRRLVALLIREDKRNA